MIAFDWNSLRQGDLVVVHEHTAEVAAVPQRGVVEFVWVRRPTNEVGIRIDTDAGPRVLWPIRQEIHDATLSGAAACHWCARGDRGQTIDPRLN